MILSWRALESILPPHVEGHLESKYQQGFVEPVPCATDMIPLPGPLLGGRHLSAPKEAAPFLNGRPLAIVVSSSAFDVCTRYDEIQRFQRAQFNNVSWQVPEAGRTDLISIASFRTRFLDATRLASYDGLCRP